MATLTYNSGKRAITEFNFLTTPMKCFLVSSSYTPDIDLHTQDSDASAFAVSPILTTSGMDVYTDNFRDGARHQCDFLVWSNLTATARGLVFYVEINAGYKPLVCYYDFGSDFISDAGTFTVWLPLSTIFTVGLPSGYTLPSQG